MTVAVYTLGCKLNQCESEALASSFDSRGFFIGKASGEADIYIINTCTVTTKAEQKARRMIRKLSAEHPESVVLVTGCYAQLDSVDLILGDNVVVVPHDYKDDINRLPEHLQKADISPGPGFVEQIKSFFAPVRTAACTEARTPGESSSGSETVSGDSNPDRFWYESVDFNYHTRAFLKIQDGCDNSCAYCRVTIARGNSVSLDADSVIRQFSELQQKGYREIVLTGVNLTSYNSQGLDFSGILLKIVAEAEKAAGKGSPFARIRLTSLEPETIDERMARAVESDLVCPHFHIPVQSGSNRILSLMRRHNTRETIIEAVERLRSVKTDPFIAADVIAGFPGETDEDFLLTKSLLDDCDFSFLHVFPYSSRPGTAAALMKNQVPQRISGERTSVLRRLSSEKHDRYCRRWLGKEIDVLIEEKDEENWSGTSGNYLKSEVCDIINDGSGRTIDSGVCRSRVEANSNGIVKSRFLRWL